MVKSLDAPYEAGRRGAGWLKVKPRHTLDLVVLAAEWGHGRRRGLAVATSTSARARPTASGFVMLGKTFKGLTDAMLTWQTERLLELAVARDDWVVHVRPELVVEIAFDGVQTSPRYPGGVALRFARVLRHRPDKRAEEADTLDAVLADPPRRVSIAPPVPREETPRCSSSTPASASATPTPRVRFYEALGFERRGRLNFESAYNIYMGLPGDGDRLELTVNRGREEPYDLGEGYNHMAVTVEDLDALLAKLAEEGVEPEKPPYAPGGREEVGRICFVRRPRRLPDRADRRGRFPTPQDPDD